MSNLDSHTPSPDNNTPKPVLEAKLPFELFEPILSKLAPSDVARCARVSKGLGEIASVMLRYQIVDINLSTGVITSNSSGQATVLSPASSTTAQSLTFGTSDSAPEEGTLTNVISTQAIPITSTALITQAEPIKPTHHPLLSPLVQSYVKNLTITTHARAACTSYIPFIMPNLESLRIRVDPHIPFDKLCDCHLATVGAIPTSSWCPLLINLRPSQLIIGGISTGLAKGHITPHFTPPSYITDLVVYVGVISYLVAEPPKVSMLENAFPTLRSVNLILSIVEAMGVCMKDARLHRLYGSSNHLSANLAAMCSEFEGRLRIAGAHQLFDDDAYLHKLEADVKRNLTLGIMSKGWKSFRLVKGMKDIEGIFTSDGVPEGTHDAEIEGWTGRSLSTMVRKRAFSKANNDIYEDNTGQYASWDASWDDAIDRDEDYTLGEI